MKYIRTKDEVLSCSRNMQDFEAILTDKRGWVKNKEIIKQTDTIEKICDEFVAWGEDQNKGKPLLIDKDQYYELIPIMIVALAKKVNVWVKGAIWTDEGLIYVAKMNDKGELELL